MDKSKYWYDYTRNDPDRENPFTDAFDHMMGEAVVILLLKIQIVTVMMDLIMKSII